MKPIDQAIGFAEIFGAHIAGITFEVEIPRPISFYTDAVVDISGMIAQARATSAANARELMSVFETAAARLVVAHEQIVTRCIGVEIADLLIEHARLRDLTKAATTLNRCLAELRGGVGGPGLGTLLA